jgi:hypothetical protein
MCVCVWPWTNPSQQQTNASARAVDHCPTAKKTSVLRHAAGANGRKQIMFLPRLVEEGNCVRGPKWSGRTLISETGLVVVRES